MKKKNSDEFVCYDNPIVLGFYLFMIFMFFISFASAIAITVCSFSSLNFIPDGLVFLLGFSVLPLIVGVGLCINLYNSKQGIFKINKKYCELNSKFKGELINLKLDNSKILRIEIKDFSKTHRAVCIVLVDDVGCYGDSSFTRNGEYIKLRFTKSRLKHIQEFLPKCPVVYSNVHPDEV